MVKRRVKSKGKVTSKSLRVELPLFVKVVAILLFISAGLTIVMGLLFILAGIIGDSFLSVSEIQEIFNTDPNLSESDLFVGSLLLRFLVVFGILMLILGIIDILIGIGLFKRKNWARILVVILSIIGMASGIIKVFTGVFIGIIDVFVLGIVAWYFTYHKDVKRAFREK